MDIYVTCRRKMQKPPECSECSLGRKFKNKEGDLITLGQSFTLLEGKPRFGVYLVGEAAGRNEAQEGLPFRPNGESGSLITHLIEHTTIHDPELGKSRKMKRGDFLWDNIIKCRPPNDELSGRNYEKDAIEHCKIYNQRSFEGNFHPSTFNKVI